jgi:hypothetical protein
MAGTGYVEVSHDDAAIQRRLITQSGSRSESEAADFLRLVSNALVVLGQHPFYEFASSLLTYLHIPTRASRAGDTSLRMDAVAPHPLHSIPIEIKSPTEVGAADLKSVRQALENHVIMRARETDPTTPDTATFAIGFQRLPARTDVHELAADIERTYGVRVRVFSTLWLLDRAVEAATERGVLDVDDMRLGRIME